MARDKLLGGHMASGRFMARVGTSLGEGHEAKVTWLDGGHIAWWRAHD